MKNLSSMRKRTWDLIGYISQLQFIVIFVEIYWPFSGVATGVARGAECHPWQQNFAKNREKIGEKSGKKKKNREEKAKIGKFLSLCPS